MSNSYHSYHTQVLKIERCLNFCRIRSYTHAGVSDGHSCFCSTWLPPDDDVILLQNRLPDKLCRTNHCTGDPSYACGGDDAVAVYESKTPFLIVNILWVLEFEH